MGEGFSLSEGGGAQVVKAPPLIFSKKKNPLPFESKKTPHKKNPNQQCY